MASFMSWLLASTALCSSLTVQEPSYELPVLPALQWKSRFQMTELANTKNPVLLSSGESAPSRQEHHVRVLMDHEIPSATLSKVASAVDNSDGQGEVLLALPDTGVLPYLDTATALSPGSTGGTVSSITQAPSPSPKSTPAGSLVVLLPSSLGPADILRADEPSETAHRPAGAGSSGLSASPAGRRSSPPSAVGEELSGPGRPRPGPASTERRSAGRRTGKSGPEPPLIANTGRAAAIGAGLSSDGAEAPLGRPAVEVISARQKAALANLAKARASTMVGLTFGAMSLLLVTWYGVNKFRDRWHYRHYRKVNFLVAGMYNT